MPRQGRKIPLGFARRDFVQGLQATKEKCPCPFPQKVVSDSGAYESSLALLDLLGRMTPLSLNRKKRGFAQQNGSFANSQAVLGELAERERG